MAMTRKDEKAQDMFFFMMNKGGGGHQMKKKKYITPLKSPARQ